VEQRPVCYRSSRPRAFGVQDMALNRHLVDLTNRELEREVERALRSQQLPFQLFSIGRSPDSPHTVTFRFVRHATGARDLTYSCSGRWTVEDLKIGIVRHLQEAERFSATGQP